MSSISGKRQRSRLQTSQHPSKKRRIKRQQEYHSSSSEDEDDDARPDVVDGSAHTVVDAPSQISISKLVRTETEAEATEPAGTEAGAEAGAEAVETEDLSASEDEDGDSEASSISDDDDGSAAEDDNPNTTKVRKRTKRNDPTAFANSINKILGTKLTVSKRADPVLSRSKDAAAASRETQDKKLEVKAKQQIRQEKRALLDTGRVKDVLGLQDPGVSTEDIMAREKRYKKLAQQGVIRLFNAVLAAQMKGQEASRAAREQGVIGIGQREEQVNQMSKQGFLDLIAGGGKK